MHTPQPQILESTQNFSACFFGRHKKLFEMREKKIVTIPEYMVIYNFHFGHWQSFLDYVKIPKKRLRVLYASGMTKIKKYVKTLET